MGGYPPNSWFSAKTPPLTTASVQPDTEPTERIGCTDEEAAKTTEVAEGSISNVPPSSCALSHDG